MYTEEVEIRLEPILFGFITFLQRCVDKKAKGNTKQRITQSAQDPGAISYGNLISSLSDKVLFEVSVGPVYLR